MLRGALIFLAVGATAVAISLALDRAAFDALAPVDVLTLEPDWYRMLRVAGYLPAWWVVAVALLLIDWPLRRTQGFLPAVRRGALLMWATLLAGAAGEALKLIVRRERPSLLWDARAAHWGGHFVFRPFNDGLLQSRHLGMPSSHAVVAFAAAWMLCRLHPRAWPVWLALAAGCAVTRLLSHAHVLSDVTAGAVLAFAVVWAVWRVNAGIDARFAARPHRPPVASFP